MQTQRRAVPRRVLFLAVGLAVLVGCGPPAEWKCVDNAGFNCTCHSPPSAGDTATSCASFPCCIHFEDSTGMSCVCKQVSANTCATTEINARQATGATNVKIVTACPG